MRIIYDCFEIRELEPKKFEVVKWNDKQCSSTCIVIAFIEEQKEDYELRSVGMRFVEEYSMGLAEFITKFVDYLTCLKELRERGAENDNT